ncbi:MAG: BatA domain-containing protein [Opitutaceae bacterium]
MELTLSNPWGLLGLLAIPVIIAIHFLQRRSRTYVISTLFLVPQSPMQARSGSRFQFWRNSVSFWMQILAALLLTWLLVQPRWIAADFRQRVVVIYDSSVSMQAFPEAVESGLKEIVEAMTSISKRNEWILLPSEMRDGVLYRGDDADAFIEQAMTYVPSAGQHSLDTAFRLAAELGSDGVQRVIFLTDHINEVPPGVELVAIGLPLENVGFSGLSIETRDGVPMWRASVRNYGTQAKQLTWQLMVDGGLPVEATLDIPAGSTKVLTSRFPEAADAAVQLQLPDDAFKPDNRITIFQPQRKSVNHVMKEIGAFTERLLPVVESVAGSALATVPDGAHFIWSRIGSVDGANSEAPFTVQFAQQDPDNLKRMQGFYTVESDPLMDGLNWNSLVYCPLDETRELQANERPLLWHDKVPLISIRERSNGRDLYFNFDPHVSNALRLPGFLVLLNRFVVEGEATLALPYRDNFEGNQSLGLEHLRLDSLDELKFVDSLDPSTDQSISRGQTVRAPILASTFSVELNDESFLEASVYFAETTEADFKNADSANALIEKSIELVKNNSREDFLAPVWLVLLAAVFLLNWYFIAKGR